MSFDRIRVQGSEGCRDRAIVFGAPRSGTTFLMRFLNRLPGAECVWGNLFPVGVAHLAAQELPAEVREVLQRSFRAALADYLTSRVYHARPPALRKWWISSRSAGTLADAARGRRTEYMLIYKEPFLAFAPELAYQALPQARIIYIFRDGRDVADSLVRSYDVLSDRKLADLDSNEVMIGRLVGDLYVPWWVAPGDEGAFLDATPYVRAIWMWREMVTRSKEFLDRPEVVASGRVLQVRYEDLASDPRAQGEAIARHLDREVTPKMAKLLQAMHARSVGIHSRRDPGELLEAERLAGAELEGLAYPLGLAASPATGSS